MKNLIIVIISFSLVFSCSRIKNPGMTEAVPAFDVKNMDTTINPGDDFFVFANGEWMKNNPIPDDKNIVSTFDELSEKSRLEILEIIKVAAANDDAPSESPAEKIGQFYRAGMDTVKIENQGITPIKLFFDKIDEINDIEDVQTTAAFFQSYQISPFFILFSSQDQKNSNNIIGNVNRLVLDSLTVTFT